MSENNNLYKSTGRKFNDLWALMLYIIIMSGTVFLCYTQGKSNLKGGKDLSLLKMPSGMQVVTFLLLCLCTAVVLIFSFLYIPVVIMHISFVMLPALSIASIFIFGHNPVCVVLSIFGAAMGILFYFFSGRNNIKFSAKVAQAATKIILVYMPVVLIMIFSFMAIVIGLSIAFSIAFKDDSQYAIFNSSLGVLVTFCIFWTFFALIYFMRVFISTIVCLDISSYGHVSSILGEALRNTFYALGTIMVGALLIATVMTLKMLVSNRNRERNNLFSIILLILISVLEDIVQFINDWAYVHVALYGQSYSKTVKSSFRELTSGRGRALVNSLCIVYAINFLSFVCAAGYLLFTMYTTNTKIVLNDHRELLLRGYTVLCLFMFVDSLGMVFDSGTKAFLLSYNRSPEAIKEKYPKVYEVLKKQESKV